MVICVVELARMKLVAHVAVTEAVRQGGRDEDEGLKD